MLNVPPVGHKRRPSFTYSSPTPAAELSDEAEAAIGKNLCDLTAKNDAQGLMAALTQLGAGPFASYLNRSGPHKRTPLHVAASGNLLSMVDLILAQGAYVNPLDEDERTPLELAEKESHHDVAAALRARGGFVAHAQKQEQLGQLIHAAARGDLEAITALIGKGADPAAADYDMRTPLHLACSEGRMRVLTYLLNLNVPLSPVDRFGGTPLKYAQQYGHWDIARFLEKRGAKLPTGPDGAAAPTATPPPARTSVQVFSMCDAARRSDLAEINKLLTADPTLVNATDYDARTPLHVAAAEGRAEVVELLLKKGADLALKDRWGCTALHDASRHGHTDVAALLHSGGGSPQLTRGPSALEFQIKRKPLPDLTDPSSHSAYSPLLVPSASKAAKVADSCHTCCTRFGRNRARLHTAGNWLVRSVCESYAWDLAEFWVAEPQRASLACCHVIERGMQSEEVLAVLRDFRQMSKAILIDPNVDPIGNVVYIPNVSTLPQTAFLRLPHARAAHLRSLLVVPFFDDAEMLGVLCFFRIQPDKDTPPRHDPSATEMAEIQYAATLTARMLVCQVQMKADRLSMHDYATALIMVIEGSLGLLSRSANVPYAPSHSPAPMSLAQQIYMPSSPSSPHYSHHQPSDSSPHSDTNQPCSPPRFSILPLLVHLGCINLPMRWAFALHSDEHKAAVRVLACLAFNATVLKSKDLLTPPLLRSLTQGLRFLNATSPVPGARTPVKARALEALEKLCDDKILDQMPPPFSVADPSPISKQVAVMATQVQALFTSHPRYAEVAAVKRKLPPAPIEPSEVFYAVGNTDGTTTRQKDDEIKRLTDASNALVKDSKPLTPDAICDLHSLILLEDGAEPGNYRTEVTVGSYMKLAYYRVFMPPEEIATAMDTVCAGLVLLQDNPVAAAFYAFAVIVYFVHPFEDGNGRMSRLLSNIILRRAGYSSVLEFSDKIVTGPEFIAKFIFSGKT